MKGRRFPTMVASLVVVAQLAVAVDAAPASSATTALFIYVPISVSDVSPRAGASIQANVGIANASGHAVHAKKLGLGGRGPGGWQDIQDCAPFYEVTIASGTFVTVPCSLAVPDVGAYTLFAVMLDDADAWIEILTANGASQKAIVHVQARAEPAITSSPAVGSFFRMPTDTPGFRGPGLAQTHIVPAGAVVFIKDGPRSFGGRTWWDESEEFIGGGSGWFSLDPAPAPAALPPAAVPPVVPKQGPPAPPIAPKLAPPAPPAASPTPNVSGVRAVWIRDLNAKYGALGGARSFLGPPRSAALDATPGPTGTGGLYAVYASGVIHVSNLGAFETHGDILAAYTAMGGSGSWLGFPVSDEIAGTVPGTRRSIFEHGLIAWDGTGYRAQPPPLPEDELRWVGDGYLSMRVHCEVAVRTCLLFADSATAQALADEFDNLARQAFDVADLGAGLIESPVGLLLAPELLESVFAGTFGVPAYSLMANQLRFADHGAGVVISTFGPVCCSVGPQ